jgi:hypothetical protein
MLNYQRVKHVSKKILAVYVEVEDPWVKTEAARSQKRNMTFQFVEPDNVFKSVSQWSRTFGQVRGHSKQPWHDLLRVDNIGSRILTHVQSFDLCTPWVAILNCVKTSEALKPWDKDHVCYPGNICPPISPHVPRLNTHFWYLIKGQLWLR